MAQLRMGAHEAEQHEMPGPTGVSFDTYLSHGKTTMPAGFAQQDGKPSGAYFAYVKGLGNSA